MLRSIVLAGGEGERTRPFIQRWLGRHRPKQYCCFVGRRSMFQHTVDRADRLTSGAHRFSVVSEGHRPLVHAQLRGRLPGRILWQPENRGTAAGILWPISCLMAKRPDDIAIIHPSDHFVWPEESFLSALLDAVRAVEQKPDRLVLVGAKPDRLELDYGWIQPDGPDGEASCSGSHRLRRVGRFLEKPSNNQAARALAAGALWNTLILVGAVRTIWQLGRYCLPQTMELLEWLRSETGAPQENEVTQRIYASLPNSSFSAEVLERAPEFLRVMELNDVEWSDWGRPERIAQSIQWLGRKPAFPLDLLQPDSHQGVPPSRAADIARPALPSPGLSSTQAV